MFAARGLHISKHRRNVHKVTLASRENGPKRPGEPVAAGARIHVFVQPFNAIVDAGEGTWREAPKALSVVLHCMPATPSLHNDPIATRCRAIDFSRAADQGGHQRLPNQRQQAITYPALIGDIVRQIPDEEPFLVHEPPDQRRQDRNNDQRAPP